MQGIPPDDISGLGWGDYPDIEALAFVFLELRGEAERILRDKMNPPKKQRPYEPMQFV